MYLKVFYRLSYASSGVCAKISFVLMRIEALSTHSSPETTIYEERPHRSFIPVRLNRGPYNHWSAIGTKARLSALAPLAITPRGAGAGAHQHSGWVPGGLRKSRLDSLIIGSKVAPRDTSNGACRPMMPAHAASRPQFESVAKRPASPMLQKITT